MPTPFRVLCVDDDPELLKGLALQLRRKFEVVTAPDGPTALTMLADNGPFAVICSDMRMPGMDGAAVLRRAREIAPNTTRLMLTGHADLETAAAAINDGRIFRFLTKPTTPAATIEAFLAAAEQHRLVTVEADLLENTLRGAIKALCDLLALASPSTFGRAQRVRQMALMMASELDLTETWPLEVAALLSHAGAISLPEDVQAKIQTGKPLTTEEQQQYGRVPLIAEDLIAGIPRMEAVREVLVAARTRVYDPSRPTLASNADAIPLAGRILRVATDFDYLDAQEMHPELILSTMRGRSGVYDSALLDHLAAQYGTGAEKGIVYEVPLSALEPGMQLGADLFANNGVLVAARGSVISRVFLERVRNARPGSIVEPVRIVTAPGAGRP